VDGVAAEIERLGYAAPAEVIDRGAVDDDRQLPHRVVDEKADIDAAGSPGG
jgi:hypothetical protein